MVDYNNLRTIATELVGELYDYEKALPKNADDLAVESPEVIALMLENIFECRDAIKEVLNNVKT